MHSLRVLNRILIQNSALKIPERSKIQGDEERGKKNSSPPRKRIKRSAPQRLWWTGRKEILTTKIHMARTPVPSKPSEDVESLCSLRGGITESGRSESPRFMADVRRGEKANGNQGQYWRDDPRDKQATFRKEEKENGMSKMKEPRKVEGDRMKERVICKEEIVGDELEEAMAYTLGISSTTGGPRRRSDFSRSLVDDVSRYGPASFAIAADMDWLQFEGVRLGVQRSSVARVPPPHWPPTPAPLNTRARHTQLPFRPNILHEVAAIPQAFGHTNSQKQRIRNTPSAPRPNTLPHILHVLAAVEPSSQREETWDLDERQDPGTRRDCANIK
ncbi:hypothetical protein K438DRAFT_1786173 [Mycena galopus ATCC 62051]|nr:hypothetical protein K438DRAFT_1786173 [Mycena galopus ATCC 62051]